MACSGMKSALLVAEESFVEVDVTKAVQRHRRCDAAREGGLRLEGMDRQRVVEGLRDVDREDARVRADVVEDVHGP